MLITKSTSPRSIISMKQPPRPAGVRAPGDRQSDGGVVRLGEHLVGVDSTRFTEPGRVERLKPFVDQPADVGAAPRAVIANGLAGEERFADFCGEPGAGAA